MKRYLFTKETGVLFDLIFPLQDIIRSYELNVLYFFLNNIEMKPLTYFSLSKKYKSTEVLLVSDFASKEVISKSKGLEKCVLMKLKVGLIHIEVIIYHNGIKDLDNFINILKEYIHFIVSFSNRFKKNIQINIFLNDLKKTVHQNKLSKNNINSASCLNNDLNNFSVINIWRKEELLKVIIHELIHALCFDNYRDTKEIIDHYNIRYNTSSHSINTNEAYTELWANLINCFLISKKAQTNNEIFFYNLVSLEKYFALYQAHKIFYLTNLDSKEKMDINKDTNILSYYIIRMELYNNINKFLEYCRINNYNYIKLLNRKSYLSFLKTNKKIKKNNKRFNTINPEDFTYKTLRMTLNELKI